MKKIILALAMCTSISVFATGGKEFGCFNVGGTEEWTVDIDLQTGKAAFFDNDSWSYMKLTDRKMDSSTGHYIYFFEGKDASGGPLTRLKMSFDINSKKINLFANNGRGKVKLLGSAICKE